MIAWTNDDDEMASLIEQEIHLFINERELNEEEKDVYIIGEKHNELVIIAKKKIEEGFENIKVDWNYNEDEIENAEEIKIDITDKIFGDDNKVGLTVFEKALFGDDYTKEINIELLDISVEELIIEVLSGLINAEERINEISAEILEIIDEQKLEPDLIAGLNNEYILRKMSSKFIEPEEGPTDNEIDILLHELFNLDSFLENYGEKIDEIVTDAKTILQKDENDVYQIMDNEFKQIVIDNIVEDFENKDKENLESNYKEQIKDLTISKIIEKLEENE